MTRLYIDLPLTLNGYVLLTGETHHYIKNVLRARLGETLSLFNSRDGEWRGKITEINKKEVGVDLYENIFKGSTTSPMALAFALLKNNAMSWLIEKATELGVTHFHPIITHYTQNQPFNMVRALKIAQDATQQCERLDMPVFYEPVSLDHFLNSIQGETWYGAIERDTHAQPIHALACPKGYLIGPEGGWHDIEKEKISKQLTPIYLGPRILRAETAALMCISANGAHKVFI